MGRLSRRVADPRFYLRAVIVLSALGLVVLPFLADAINAVASSGAGPGGACRVVRVIDGDTADLHCADRGLLRARFAGFDAPELFSPGCAAELVAAQKAKWALRRMIFEAEERSFQFRGSDRYGRVLVGVRLDGEALSRRMIEGGYARPYGGGMRGGWCG